jgi:ferric-dicitrate binding protein FerR (iron transport regulator)
LDPEQHRRANDDLVEPLFAALAEEGAREDEVEPPSGAPRRALAWAVAAALLAIALWWWVD